jgi:hypothetical protein
MDGVRIWRRGRGRQLPSEVYNCMEFAFDDSRTSHTSSAAKENLPPISLSGLRELYMQIWTHMYYIRHQGLVEEY